MNGLYDPIDPRITTDCLVLRVDENDFKILVGRVLIDPVGIQNPQIRTPTTNTFLGSGFERALIFELIHTLIGRLACCKQIVLSQRLYGQKL